MSSAVLFTREAPSELEAAAVWYEERGAGLGHAFIAAVDATVERITRWPRIGAPVEGLDPELDVRRAPVARFPYYLAYLVADEAVHILAVAHHRRRPLFWVGRAPSNT